MSIVHAADARKSVVCISLYVSLLVFVSILAIHPASAQGQGAGPAPVLSLNFEEGSGANAFDGSGLGDSGTIVGATRAENTGCGRSLIFDGTKDYVTVPYTVQNHPLNAISVSLWFYTDSFSPQGLLSTYNDGGYRLGFDDGNDLWWTVNLEDVGDVSVAVQHEGIAPRQWHHVMGTFDGNVSRIYLDGVLINQVNATGTIHYMYPNNVIIGANAGPGSMPDLARPQYFHGSIDNVRIYNASLTQGQVLDDRFQCAGESNVPDSLLHMGSFTPRPEPISGTLSMGGGETATKILSFSNLTTNGTWDVKVPPGSKLSVLAQDQYSRVYPDEWYVEIDSQNSRINRGVAFPNTNNAPVEGVLSSGNGTVLIRYFDGPARFPSSVVVEFTCTAPPQHMELSQSILANPIIVIYSASWVTLIALILVMVWLHVRSKRQR